MSAIPLSATLAANEILIRKRQAGEPVLPLSFGEAGLPRTRCSGALLTHAAGTATRTARGRAARSALRRPRATLDPAWPADQPRIR
mgnify:CR=1 FL=1